MDQTTNTDSTATEACKAVQKTLADFIRDHRPQIAKDIRSILAHNIAPGVTDEDLGRWYQCRVLAACLANAIMDYTEHPMIRYQMTQEAVDLITKHLNEDFEAKHAAFIAMGEPMGRA